LPLPAHQLLTLTFALPADPDSRMRLLASRTALRNSEIAALVQQAYPPQQVFSAVGAERWFARAPGSVVRLPWENPFRPVAQAPSGFTGEQWPVCRIELGADGTARCKDCTVEFDGLTANGFDEYGSYGSWKLSWGNTLELLFELPQKFHAGQAILLVDGEPEGSSFTGALPRLAVTVNGWRLNDADLTAGSSAGLQRISSSLSQYLQPGLNAIELSLDAFADTQVLIDVVELWAR
jgi:hypothetical protein